MRNKIQSVGEVTMRTLLLLNRLTITATKPMSVKIPKARAEISST